MRQLNLNEASSVSGGVLTFSAESWDNVVRLGGAYVGWTESSAILGSLTSQKFNGVLGYAGQFVTACVFMEAARMTNDFMMNKVEPFLDNTFKSITG